MSGQFGGGDEAILQIGINCLQFRYIFLRANYSLCSVNRKENEELFGNQMLLKS